MNKIYRLNEAEGIFYPAFDKYICRDEQVFVDHGEIVRLWDSLTFRGGRNFTVHWSGEAALLGYDNFLAFLSFPAEASMKVTGVIDGKSHVLVENANGDENPVELKGSFAPSGKDGGILTDIYLTLTSPSDKNVIILSWLGLSRSKGEAALEENVPRWKDEWDGQIKKGCAGKLDKSMVLDEEEGERLKKAVVSDQKLQRFYRTNAEEAMKIDHRAIMREYMPQSAGMYRFVRVRDRGREHLENPILNLAIAGYVLGEASYSAHAAELILAAVAMKWCEGPVCDMAGSQFHHVCFTEDHMLSSVTLAMGFLGGILGDEAKEWVADKILDAWKTVWEKCSEPGYRNFMNQGIVGSRGAMLGAVYLQLHRGNFEEQIESVYQKHSRLVETYLTKEGQCAEGGSYFEYSFSTSILLWHAYAKYSKKSWRQVVPETFRRAGRYQEALMSVNDRRGRRISINCGSGNEVSTLLLVFMTLVCDFPEGNNYLTARFSGEDVERISASFDMLIYQYYKEQIRLHPYYKPQEEEISLEKSGLLTYRQGSTKLLVSAERNPYTGHFHEDRGQVVLQAQGETLLPDLGTVSYGNSKSLLMDKQSYHNLACPVDLIMKPESEIGMKAAAAAAHPITENLTIEDMAVPEAKVLYHEVLEDGYAFGVETGMLFGKNIKGIRKGRLSGHNLYLTDDWSFEEPHPLQVTFLAYHPWEINEDGKSAVSGIMTLLVQAGEEIRFETEDGMIDSLERDVYVLRVQTPAALSHTINSRLTWKEKELSELNSGTQNRQILQELLNKGGTVRIEKPGTYEIEDTVYIKSGTHLILGKGVVFKRSASSVGSFFLINEGAFTGKWDSDITIEGLNLITNGVEARHNAAVYGLTGEISLFRIKHLHIFDFICMDLPKLSYGLHICTFEDIVLERLRIEGRKDAVHLGTGKQFVIRHGLFRTFDDPIALNAHDYAVANPQMGWIEDGLIEDCYDLADKDTTGYFCRILAGSWVDWQEGMEIQNSDTVVNNGRVYRAFQKPDGVIYRSVTPPIHAEGMCTLDGINWVMVQEDVVYNCGCRNLHFKDIRLQKVRETALSIHFDNDNYSRSVYPGSVMPVQENIVFENIVVQNKTGCLVRSITPVDTIKILNSVIGTKEEGNSLIRLETLPGREGQYGMTRILLQGNTCYGGMEDMVECQEGREYEMVQCGNLVLGREPGR